MVENPNEPIVCACCENVILPVSASHASTSANNAVSPATGKIRIDGLSTTASALAYLEVLSESYGWDTFVYSNSMTIPELDVLAEDLIRKSADDKNTWIFCFRINLLPYCKKLQYINEWKNEIIREYKKDSPDIQSLFSSYSKVTALIKNYYQTLNAKLDKYLDSAAKYGASAKETVELKASVPRKDEIDAIPTYSVPEQIPEIYEFRRMKNTEIVQRLAQNGIDADAEYRKAVTYINENNYLYALSSLYTLEGYLDSEQLIDKINNYFVLSNVLENGGNLFYYKADNKASTYSLYPTTGKNIDEKPIIRDISQILTNCANVLYYLDFSGKLRAYDLTARKKIKIDKSPVFLDEIVHSRKKDGKMYLYSGSENSMTLHELNLLTGKIRELRDNIDEIVSFTDSKLAFFQSTTDNDSSSGKEYKTIVFDVVSGKETVVSHTKVTVCGYLDSSVVYMSCNPNNYNLNLYIKNLDNGSERLLEKNVYGFCKIINGKIYYYVGSSRNQELVSINPDGTSRSELSLCIKNILFCKGGWIYFERGNKYNTVLCRSKLDGTDRQVIATEIDSYIDITGGYLYYKDTADNLCRVLMDGAGYQLLQHKVYTVLNISENGICYTAYDDSITDESETGGEKYHSVLSVYYTDCDGGNFRKLVYDIDTATKFDERNIYYTTPAKDNKKYFCRLEPANGITDELLEIDLEPKGCYIATSVYGSYDCPEVWRFRRFRDNILAESAPGRAFIRAYYAVSPTLVRYFGECTLFKKFFGFILDRFDRKLEEKGIENTPYSDREW